MLKTRILSIIFLISILFSLPQAKAELSLKDKLIISAIIAVSIALFLKLKDGSNCRDGACSR